MSSRELTEWRCYLSLYGTTSEREDLRFAQLCMLVHNANFKPKKQVKDFLPRWGKGNTLKENMPTKKELKQKLTAFAAYLRSMKKGGKKNVPTEHRRAKRKDNGRRKPITEGTKKGKKGN